MIIIFWHAWPKYCTYDLHTELQFQINILYDLFYIKTEYIITEEIFSIHV